MPEMEVHWGLALGIIGCILSWVVTEKTTSGFAARIAGANVRVARVQGQPVGRLILGFPALAGAIVGLAGFFEVTAVQGSANASLAAGYGFTGILIAFLAMHNPLAIITVAILLAGFQASSGLIQRRMDLPDATVLVLQGFGPVAILGGAIRVSTPFLFVSPGAVLTERSGRITLGLGGTLVFGARRAMAPPLLPGLPGPESWSQRSQDHCSACCMGSSARCQRSTTSPSASR
jgi:ABC-type uncharacterized transport system permease subunit